MPSKRLAPNDPRHGTVNGYTNLRCRCSRCRKAHRENHLNYMHENPEQQEKARQRAQDRYHEERTA